MSPEVEAAFPVEAQALYAGFQDLYQRSVSVEDVRRYPSAGRNAYNEEEVACFKATYEYLLEGLLDDAERAKRMLPAKKQRRGGRAATSAAAAAPSAPSPPAAAAPRTTPRAGRADETEDDYAPLFATPGPRKRGRKAR
jgi:hypothetical protein